MAKKQKKGANRPRKSDVEAFESGVFTPLVKKIVSALSSAESAFRVRQMAEEKFQRKIDRIEKKLGAEATGTVATHPSGELRLVIQRNSRVKSNALAEEGARLVQDYAKELMDDVARTEDEKQFAQFLFGIVQRSKSQIRMNKNLAAFLKMQFTDKRLREAQQLFGQGFDVVDSKRGAYLQVPNARGKWEGAVWNEEKKRWEAE